MNMFGYEIITNNSKKKTQLEKKFNKLYKSFDDFFPFDCVEE